MATDATSDAVSAADHYLIVCSQIPNLTMSQKLDVIEQLTRSMRSTAATVQPPRTDLEQRQAARREVLTFIDELEREAREKNQEPISMTDRDHDRIIYGL